MQRPSVEFKGASFTLSVLKLSGHTLDQLKQQLNSHVERAPRLFHQMPVLLDLSALDPSNLSLSQVLSQVQASQLTPMGVLDPAAPYRQQAEQLALPCIRGHRHTPSRHGRTTVIEQPVRSGQQVYGKDGDLVVMAGVSAGAELVADGSIHVYGPMRGRAFAGATGNSDARIFCHDLQAELLAIAGTYHLAEERDPKFWGKPTMIRLEQNRLCHSLLRPFE
ncbi:septum site-determining protein MinC [Ferrimonas gelatinilytica]